MTLEAAEPLLVEHLPAEVLPQIPRHPQRVVVMPYHNHPRVEGKDRIFQQPWGMDRVMAEVHARMLTLKLDKATMQRVPYREFTASGDQHMYIDLGTEDEDWAERVAQKLDAQLKGANLPVFAFAEAIKHVAAPAEVAALQREVG